MKELDSKIVVAELEGDGLDDMEVRGDEMMESERSFV